MFPTGSTTTQFNMDQSGLSIPGFGPCSESACDQTFARLFNCAHHCTKMVCLRHLIEHDRVFEQNKRELDEIQIELQRVWSIYSSHIDETKIQREFEQKLNEHTQLIHDTNMLLRSDSTDIERFRIVIDQLKKIICEKEPQQARSFDFVKVEPVDDIEEKPNLKSSDEHGLENDHRLETYSANKNLSQTTTDTIITNDDNQYTIDTIYPISKISGECPLWRNGVYGLSKEHHGIRLCKRAHFHLLNKHMRDFHGLSTPTANLIARAVHSKVPVTKCLFVNHAQVLDFHLVFFCPFGTSRCSLSCRLPVQALKTHLINAHQVSNWKAKNMIEKLQAQQPDEATKMIKKTHTTYDDKQQIG